MTELFRKRKKIYDTLVAELGKPPTAQQFAYKLGLPRENAAAIAYNAGLDLTATRQVRTRDSYDSIRADRREKYDRLVEKLGRFPTKNELAEEWEITPSAIETYVSARASRYGDKFKLSSEFELRKTSIDIALLKYIRLNPNPSKKELMSALEISKRELESSVNRLRNSGHTISLVAATRVGKLNHNWRGGVAEYPDHSLFKRQRLIVLKRSSGKCEICGVSATEIHHIDEDKSNHDLTNLLAVCRRCHLALHGGSFRASTVNGGTSKIKRIFGISAAELAEAIGCSTAWVYERVRNGKEEEVRKAYAESKKETEAANEYVDSRDEKR